MIFLSLFLIGLFGLFNSKNNLIKLFISFELQFLSISGIILIITFFSSQGFGLIIAFFLLMIAGAESAIGLIIFYIYTEEVYSLRVDSLTFLKS
jgi:NADH-quinone oxidoreductase subunit K